MRVGILGSGDVGRKLADSFIEIRHIVKIDTRNPNQDKLTEWMAKYRGKKSFIRNFCTSSIIWRTDVIATLWDGTADAIKMANPKNFAGNCDLMSPIHHIFQRDCHQD